MTQNLKFNEPANSPGEGGGRWGWEVGGERQGINFRNCLKTLWRAFAHGRWVKHGAPGPRHQDDTGERERETESERDRERERERDRERDKE